MIRSKTAQKVAITIAERLNWPEGRISSFAKQGIVRDRQALVVDLEEHLNEALQRRKYLDAEEKWDIGKLIYFIQSDRQLKYDRYKKVYYAPWAEGY